MKHKHDAEVKRKFTDVYRRISNQLDFEENGFKIIYASVTDDVVKEGHALHHCVGSYVERITAKECIILLLRQRCDESRPFYTIEVRG